MRIIVCSFLLLTLITAAYAQEISVGSDPKSNKLVFDKNTEFESKNGEPVVIMPYVKNGEEEYWITNLYLTEEAQVLYIEPENVDSTAIKKELEDFRTLYLWVWIPLNVLLALAVASY
jgi:hypothetical protein